jgi:putative nucleotidyltransferase with HDIG domain
MDLAQRLVDKIDQLPPMPSNVMKLRRAVADPNMNYNLIAPIIKEDPSICADLLRIANSALYGVGHNVDTVEESIRYFGMPSLVEFVAAACSERIVRQTFSKVKNLEEYLNHSRRISLASSLTANMLKVNVHDREVFSITGLLHDIGRLIIMLVANEEKYSKELLGISWDDVQKLVNDERQLYGIDHAELGMKICKRWQFPEKIIIGVQRHHTPISGNDISFEGLVLFISEMVELDNLPENILRKSLPPEIMEKLKITPDTLVELRDLFQQNS